MATTHYTDLIDSLKSIPLGNCEGDNFRGQNKAIELVNASDLQTEEKQSVISAITKDANPSGWYYSSNGAQAGIKAAESLLLKATAQAENEAPAQAESAPVRFNYQNLKALVSNGQIFSVEFVKHGNDELRKMVCRLGVTKHLKGGQSTYSAKSNGLLPVFDMVPFYPSKRHTAPYSGRSILRLCGGVVMDNTKEQSQLDNRFPVSRLFP